MEHRVASLERRIEELDKRVDATAENLAALTTSLNNLAKALEKHVAVVSPMIDSYRGIMSAKSIILGLASVLTALGVIGYFLTNLWHRP